MIDEAVAELAPLIGKRAACRATGRPQASYYRRHRQSPTPPPVQGPKRAPKPQPRALGAAERESVRAVLNSEDFADAAPAAVYHQLLDEGVYLCSPSTMYRILRQHGEVRERRRQATHPAHAKPELLATAPNHQRLVAQSRFSRMEFPRMPWFSDRAGPADDSRITPPTILSSAP
jgi:putative transposase